MVLEAFQEYTQLTAASPSEGAESKRFFYGYWMIPIAMLGQICTAPGQTFAISAFTPAIRESLALKDSQLAAAYMIGTLLAALPLLLVGPAADRAGNRVVMTWVVVGLALACVYISSVQSLSALLIAFVLLRFLGQGALSMLSQNTAALWFHAKLGTVTAIMSVGMAAAFAVIPSCMVWSIDEFGWRNTYRLLAVLIGVIMLPLMVVVYRNHPHDVGQLPDGRAHDLTETSGNETSGALRPSQARVTPLESLTLSEAIRCRSYWIVSISMAVWALTGTGVVFYLLDIGEAAGIRREVSATVFGTFAMSMLAMQLIGGPLADRYPLHRLLAIGIGLLTVGTSLLLVVDQPWHLHAFGACFGAGQGLSLVVGATVWVRYFGPQHLGKIRGLSWSIAVAGSGVGPFILGAIKDATGDFRWGVVIFAGMLLPLVVSALFATRPSARRVQNAAERA